MPNGNGRRHQPSKELVEAAGELDRRLLEFVTYIEDDSEVNRYDELVTPAQVELRAALAQPPVTDAGKGERVTWEWRWCDVTERAPWLPVTETLTSSRIEFRHARTDATEEKPLPSSEGDEA